jgi:hypothetical protein
VLFVLIQLVPIDRSNPPVETEVAAPDDVRAILERACYDCHSHEARWPWYGYVAPVSWLVAYDISEAREHLNFSTWNQYVPKDQAKNFEEIWEEVEEGDMPLPIYPPLHPEAYLDDADLERLHAWTVEARAALGPVSDADDDEEEEDDDEH